MSAAGYEDSGELDADPAPTTMAGAPDGPRIAENRWEWLDAIEMFNQTSAVALKPAAQVIAYSLSRRAMDAQDVRTPQAHLAAVTGMSRRAVQRAVDELEAAGFLVRRASQHRAPRYALTIPAGGRPMSGDRAIEDLVPWDGIEEP